MHTRLESPHHVGRYLYEWRWGLTPSRFTDEQKSSNRGETFNNDDLDAIQAKIARWRRLRKEAQGAKNDLKRRERGDDEFIEGGSGKRIDIKYDEVESLTLTSSFRAWTDWNADLERVWAGASWKYERDNLKIIKAVSKMENTRRRPSAIIKVLSIERELPEVADTVSANQFYAKLTEEVVNQIRLSGLQELPSIRGGMVALAQRVWEGLRIKRSVSDSTPKSADPSASSRQSQQFRQGNKFYNTTGSSSNTDAKDHKVLKSDGHQEKLKTDKREKDGQIRFKPKPRVQQQRVVEPKPASSEDESTNLLCAVVRTSRPRALYAGWATNTKYR
ncbi:hypothetical protein V1509DRAFT_660022 [Lipomyces kononenkoae]